MAENDCVTKECYSHCHALRGEAVRAAADCAVAEIGLSVEIYSPDREVAQIRAGVRRIKHDAAEAYREYLKTHCPAPRAR